VEIRRLRNQDIDLSGSWLAVHGKSHQRRPAYRRLPYLAGIGGLIREIQNETKGSQRPKRALLGLYIVEKEWRPLAQEDLEGILESAGERAGINPVPDFYSLRHRFRTDWLAADIPFRLISYMMGHESTGFEAFSIYQDERLDALEETYRDAAGRLAGGYGWEEKR
jgi:integrase